MSERELYPWEVRPSASEAPPEPVEVEDEAEEVPEDEEFPEDDE